MSTTSRSRSSVVRRAGAAGLLLVFFAAGVVVDHRSPHLVTSLYRAVSRISGSPAKAKRPAKATPGVAPTATPSPPPPGADLDQFSVVGGARGLAGTVLLAISGVSPAFPQRIVEVDRSGHVVWEARVPGPGRVTDVRRLVSNNIQYVLATDRGEGVLLGGEVVEIDRTGRTVRSLKTAVTTQAEPLPGGQLLLVDSRHDVVSQVDATGHVTWSWSAAAHLKEYTPQTYTGVGGFGANHNLYTLQEATRDWVHLAAAHRLSNGSTVISARNFDIVFAVDRAGKVLWTYGPLVLKHPTCVTPLDDGRLLVTDSGNARVVEVDPATQHIEWEYSDGLLFPARGCAQRLVGGSTLITDSDHNRVVEVAPGKNVVWELQVHTPGVAPLVAAAFLS